MRVRGDRVAFGAPGIEPRWTHSNKDAVGMSYSADSRVWFTLWRGVLTEVYSPYVDHPQLRDLQFLMTDGKTFFHEEKRHLTSRVERMRDHTLGFRVTNTDPEGRYAIEKTVIADPHQLGVLQNVRVRHLKPAADPFHLYVLAAPHIDIGGWGNNGYVLRTPNGDVLAAEKNGFWLAVGASVPFRRASCGYVGSSDGWTDVSQHLGMQWEFDRAPNGNVALVGELELDGDSEFTLALGFGRAANYALTTVWSGLSVPFDAQVRRFEEQWMRPVSGLLPLRGTQSPGRCRDLYHASYTVLLAHEDKTIPGAFIASLSIPWGSAKSDDDRGGYHLVWTRDMVQTAMALLAVGDRETPRRALIYLAASQNADGGFPQNFWLNADPYWGGVQLDEVAFPILLAWRLHRERALGGFDAYPMALSAARFLVERGPVTQEDRWEEASGYSPATLAANIAALVCVATWARERGDGGSAELLESYADFLEAHVERWTVTNQGSLDPSIRRHFIRIHPADPSDPAPDEDANHGMLPLANQPPEGPSEYPAAAVVDAGFLELVRYGVYPPDDPLILDSLRLVDRVLRVETPSGPCWHRYNHDGYGERPDGGPFLGWGAGRAWPILTGERGHYALAAGDDPEPYLRAMEGFTSPTGLLPEQVWDAAPIPSLHLRPGGPTGSAMPLAWSHAEYLKLLRSASDGRVFDRIPEVWERYGARKLPRSNLEVWKSNRRVRSVPRGSRLRFQAPEPFRLHYSTDGWRHVIDTDSEGCPLGVDFVDVGPLATPGTAVEFTFFWRGRGQWEGRDFRVDVL